MKPSSLIRRVPPSIVAVVIAVAAHPAFAQQQQFNPVSWRAKSPAAPVARGSVAAVTVLASIDTGWHVYSLTQPDGGPSALTFTAATTTPASIRGRVKGPKPRIENQKAFDVPVELYDAGTAQFTVPLLVKADAALGKQTVELAATWQSCSKSVCLPPRSQKIPLDLVIAEKASSVARQANTVARNTVAARVQQSAPIRWDATIVYDSLTLPFPLDLAIKGNDVTVTLYNGAAPISSTSGRKKGDSIVVAFAHLASELRGRVDGKSLTATFGPTTGRGLHDITAHPHVDVRLNAANVPDIGGTWILPAKSAKGEGAWRFVVQQQGATATATILRVDGDAGAHVGTWANDRFVLNHFDGTRPSQLEVIPTEDGGLDVITNGARGHGKPVHALRPSVALAQGIPAPADFMNHTRAKNPDEIFRFSFPDINGQLVSNTDERFAGKVIVVEVGGTWCPNCHDEAPYLSELYKRYKARGLEVVGLDFEDSTQLKSLERPKAFVKKYGIEYPFLIAGLTAERDTKITQAEGLDSWPTTFFIGRDGKVRAIHAGFAAPASGDFHAQLLAEYDETIEKLLAEPAVATSSNGSAKR